MRVSPGRLRKHLAAWGVPYRLEPGWDTARIDPYRGRNDMQGILLHHTAGRDSLAYCMRGTYPPVRNCHFLVGRDGVVHVLSASGAYHAGLGGPWEITKRVIIPRNAGNSRLYGIEIESLGRSSRIDGSLEGMTRAQVASTAVLCAALLDAMRPGPGSYRPGRVQRHRDWTARKIDTLQDLTWWRDAIRIAQTGRRRRNRGAARIGLLDFIGDHPDGRL